MPLNVKEIDLHGLTVEDALYRLEQGIPLLYGRGVDEVLIIHGKGEGILRTEVLNYLRTASCKQYVQSIRPGEKFNLPGGEGVVKVIFRISKDRIRGKKLTPLKQAKITEDERLYMPSEQIKELVMEKKRTGKDKYLKRMKRKKRI